MPPALSEDESAASSAGEEVPARPPPKKNSKQPAKPKVVEEPDDDDEDVAEDEYIVEKISDHKTVGKEVVYHVKWMGYEKKADMTWEPEDNLGGALEVLNEYWEEIGGRPEPGGKSTKRKGRKSMAESESATPASSAKRIKKEPEWTPPPGSWENDVEFVDTVEESLDPKTGAPMRYAYLNWNNGKKTQHPLPHVYVKCPQKMLKYYESHLVFSHNDEATNGQTDVFMKSADDYED
ncbi:hypothetical protein BDV95DRAFT_575655 [Massariosphaeria phaeospora]|uniref:Chromo domain-containing protein n=1 Tax=Massariosphaeria phaeospora TaxID=100035 RepID=A0A7C8IC48_9PLEO|nr:hypothetical protein BDV95DRAFT_575655 [Massariosphaeria phaeospora]